MSVNNFDDVGAFHQKFGLPSNNIDSSGPRDVEPEVLEFRTKFLEEELKEFKDAADVGDNAKMFDALIDLVYVAMGTAHLFGYPWHWGWELVQEANMAKIRAKSDGSDSVRGSSWDVVKPEGWQPPNIEGILEQMGW